jgi:hypothetical protein
MLAYVEVLADEKAMTAIGFLRQCRGARVASSITTCTNSQAELGRMAVITLDR